MGKPRIKIQTLSVYISTTLVLLLLGAMCALLMSARSLSDHIRRNMTMSVVVSGKTSGQEILKFQQQLEKLPCVVSSQYISSEQILEEQKIELGTDPVEFLGYNPYDPSINLTLKSDYARPDSMAMLEKSLLKDERVIQVVYHREIIETVNDNIRKIAAALLGFMIVLTMISWSLIGNAVRLSIYSKRFLLHTMKLVGATPGFIRRPFILSNILCGIIAAIIAIILLTCCISYVVNEFDNFHTLLNTHMMFMVYGIVLLLGILLTAVSSFFAVNRYIGMKRDDLYYV
jgi:cell division transport system permease protein